MYKFTAILLIVTALTSWGCTEKKSRKTMTSVNLTPALREGGKIIEFPVDSPQLKLFEIKKVSFQNYDLNITAPATVIGKVKRSEEQGIATIILFSSPDLTGIYSSYLQNLSVVQIARTNFNRTKDLYEHNAATGKELNDSRAELIDRQSSIAESEAKLRREGFNPKTMGKAKSGTVWLISDIPESEINILVEGVKCSISFPSYPTEKFEGKIDAIAEVLNAETRKARIRILMDDNKEKIRPGMYGKIDFILPESGLMIPKKAFFSSNAKYYVFVRTAPNIFERREILLSTETDEYIEIANGVNEGDEIVITNVYLLKGLSFGI